MKATARLEWFLGIALVLLAAQVGLGAWHSHRPPQAALQPTCPADR